MMAVNSSAESIAKILPPRFRSLQTTLPTSASSPGRKPNVSEFQKQLEAKEIVCHHLHTSHAFHSAMIDPIVEPLREAIAKINLRAPAQAVRLHGHRAPHHRRGDHRSRLLGASRARRPCEFGKAIHYLKEQGYDLFLECGPRSTHVLAGPQAIHARAILHRHPHAWPIRRRTTPSGRLCSSRSVRSGKTAWRFRGMASTRTKSASAFRCQPIPLSGSASGSTLRQRSRRASPARRLRNSSILVRAFSCRAHRAAPGQRQLAASEPASASRQDRIASRVVDLLIASLRARALADRSSPPPSWSRVSTRSR